MSAELLERCVGLPTPHFSLLVAVSGGCDSMVLLDLLIKAPYSVMVYHLDHQLREDSHLDAALVKEYCDGHNVIVKLRQADIAGLAKAQGKSIETCARDYRYRELQEIAEENGIEYICSAHHQDDQVESILMHQLRGAGKHGLVGMRAQRELGSVRLVRPLLNITRDELRSYAKINNVPWREDTSNEDLRYFRNHLRHNLIPKMQQENPHYKSQILREAEAMRDEVDIIEAIIDSEWLACLTDAHIMVDVLNVWSEEVRGSFWRRLLMAFELPVSKKNIQRFEDLLHGETSKQIDLGDWHFYRNQGRISWAQEYKELQPVRLKSGMTVGDDRYVLEEIIVEDLKAFSANEACIKKDTIKGDLSLRNIREGESWQALGAPGTKNLFQYLSDKKFPVQERASLIVVADDEGVVWIPGFTIADRVKAAVGDVCVLVRKINGSKS